MVFDWHIPDDRKGELLWVGNPFLYEQAGQSDFRVGERGPGAWRGWH